MKAYPHCQGDMEEWENGWKVCTNCNYKESE